jgi:hypothetical protein
MFASIRALSAKSARLKMVKSPASTLGLADMPNGNAVGIESWGIAPPPTTAARRVTHPTLFWAESWQVPTENCRIFLAPLMTFLASYGCQDPRHNKTQEVQMVVNRFVRYSRQGAIRLAVVAPLAALALVPVSAHAGGGPPPPPLQNVSVKVDKHATLLSSTAVSIEIRIKCPVGTDLTENQLTVSQASGATGFASIRAIACLV